MNSWCDKLRQVSAWYPQGLLTTTGLVYWELKTWSLFLSLLSPQRAPHTELALLPGLTFYVDSASLPPAVQARGVVHPPPLPLQLPSHPITLQVL